MQYTLKNISFTDIISELAEKYNLPKTKVRHLITSQFAFVNKTMREGKDKNVILTNLGKFVVKQFRKELLLSYKEYGRVQSKGEVETDNGGVEEHNIQES